MTKSLSEKVWEQLFEEIQKQEDWKEIEDWEQKDALYKIMKNVFLAGYDAGRQDEKEAWETWKDRLPGDFEEEDFT